MNKRGVVIIFSFLAAILLVGLLSAVFVQATTESRLARRQASSINAFWLAEAGIARAKSGLGTPSNVSGTIANPSDPSGNTYAYNVVSNQIGSTGYYTVVSTGTVTSPGSVVSRTVSSTIKVVPPDPSRFQYCVETTGAQLSYRAKNVANAPDPGRPVNTDSSQNFTNLFGIDMAAMEANATPIAPSGTIIASGISWVNAAGDPPEVAVQHLSGSGILVINGNLRLTGTGSGQDPFNGILYVIGSLYMSGNNTINGTVFVESTAEIADELTGSSLVSYNSSNIASSLGSLGVRSIVSWKED